MSSISDIYDKTCERLTLYYAAEQAILSGAQSYSIGNRTLTRADLKDITKTITDLISDKLSLERGNKVRIQRVVFRDQ